MGRSEANKTWLESVLRRHMGRVAAPDELWDRVVLPRVDNRREFSHPGVWVLATASALALSLFAAAWGYYPRRLSISELELLAKRGVDQDSPSVEFQSGDGLAIRTWIRNRTGLDISLPAQSGAPIEIVGARVVDGGGPAVEVRYRSGGHIFVLLASREGLRGPGVLKHAEVGDAALQNARAVSWTMAGQTYTVAAERAEYLHTACLVCHSDSSL